MTGRPVGRWRRRLTAPAGDAGSAVVEFSLVAILLLALLLGIAQVAIYLHVRNVATASAAEGARYAANADVDPAQGAARTDDILRRGVGGKTAAQLSCTGGQSVGADGVVLSTVSCTGALPVFFAPLGGVLPIKVSARSVEEGQ